MATPRTPNQKKNYDKLNKRLARYVALVQNVYDKLSLEASKIALNVGYSEEDTSPFKFSDYTETRSAVSKLMKSFTEDMTGIILAGTSEEWRQSNLVQDLLAEKVLKAYRVEEEGEKRRYFRDNSDALKAFQQRRDNGMSLSQKIWQQSATAKEGLETAISTGIEKGMSAITLSKRVSKYLSDFPALRADYKDKFGQATDVKDCEYRSIRLARSEINMAYRTAEQTRWRQMDFILGYEIKLSGSHPQHDICDELAGRYPKDFVWTGWHPNDICYVVPIIASEEEFNNDDFVPEECKEYVSDVPEQFNLWVIENQDKIGLSALRGTMPYFCRDNYDTIEHIINQTSAVKSLSKKDIDFLVREGLISKDYIGEAQSKILLSDSPENAQRHLSYIAEGISHSVFGYANRYKARNEEIAVLLDSIDMLKGKDEIARIKLINKLKTVCANETIKDLTSWGYVDGLSFKKIAKNEILSSAQTLTTKQSIHVDIPEVLYDAVLFSSKDGKIFSYEIGASHNVFSASIANDVISSYPPYLRKGIRNVVFHERHSPFDKFWEIEYDRPGFNSAASDGGVVHFYITPVNKEKFSSIMAHECGHILDTNKQFSSSLKWNEAVKNDDILFKRYFKSPKRVTQYAYTNNSEDFAECVSAFINDKETFKQMFPNRAAYLRKIAQRLSKK